MKATNNIVKLLCGTEQQGTALLVDQEHAITVRHCLKEFYRKRTSSIILVVVIDGISKEISALPGEKEESVFVYLNLEEKVESVNEIRFWDCKLEAFQKVSMFGYGKCYANGSWKELKFSGRGDLDKNSVCDLQFDLIDARDKTFAGFSGSPIYDEERSFVIGLISQEECADHEAIYIEGISVSSQKEFFEKHGIIVDNMNLIRKKIGERANTMQMTDCYITGISDTIGKLNNIILDKIVALHREGYWEKALSELKEQIQLQQGDAQTSDEIKAKFLLQQAMWILEDSYNISAASKIYQKAVHFCESLDTKVFLALRAFYSGESSARKLLEPIHSLSSFHAYMQICVNQRDGKAAIRAYETYKDIYSCNSRTWYWVSIANLLNCDFLKAEEFLKKAIDENGEAFDYCILRALIKYWKTIPIEAFHRSSSIYPDLYSEGIYFFENDIRTCVMDAVSDFKLAYQKADSVGNKKQKEQALVCWINALSVDNVLFSKVMEPLDLLKKVNPYHVIALMVDVLCGRVSQDETYEKQLKALIKKKKNVMGYIYILTEYFIKVNEHIKAKSLLFEQEENFKKFSCMEYWYMQLAYLEKSAEKRRVFANRANEEPALSEIQKKRIRCMFALDHEKDALQQLESLYDDTKEVHDLINLIRYSGKEKNWDVNLQYAKILEEEHHNPCGYLYQIKAFMKIQKFAEAYACIQKVEQLNIAEFARQIQEDKLIILEKMGEYDKAILAGEEMFYKEPSESFAHRLANLYIRRGKKSDAIQVLETAEKYAPLSLSGYQRLSGLYQHIDTQKSLDYARKSVEVSNHSSSVVSWAAINAADISMSNIMDEYWNELMEKGLDKNLFKIVSTEEMLEMLYKNYEHQKEFEMQFHKAEIPIHILVDGKSSALLSEVFYDNWYNADSYFKICFGGHIAAKIDTKIDKLILDYTSCLLLYELDVLETLASHISLIYVPSNIYPVIMDEQDKLSSGQLDLMEHKEKVMNYCIKTLKLQCVEEIVPDNLEDVNALERSKTIMRYTAEQMGAFWIDSGRIDESTVTTDEVCAVLSEYGYICEYDSDTVRKEKVMLLKEFKSKIFVDILTLEEWYKKGILDDANECFEIILSVQQQKVVERERFSWNKRKEIYNKLEKLKLVLNKIAEDGKLKWCVDAEKEEWNWKYSNLIISAITTTMQKGIAYCVDDRCMQSYGKINHIPVFGSMDIIQMMYRRGWIAEQKYLKICREFISKKNGFVMIDPLIVYRALQTSEVDSGKVLESKLLTDIRLFSEQSFYLLEKYSSIYQIGVHLSERNCYSMLHLMSVRSIIEEIWISDIELEKKVACSNWVIYEYFRIGENINSMKGSDLSEDPLIIQSYFYLIFQGMLFVSDRDIVAEYYNWLFSVISHGLEKNLVLLDKILELIKHEVHSILCDANRKNELYYVYMERTISTGINYLPEYLSQKLLEDNEIQAMFEKYFVNTVRIGENCYIPSEIFECWMNEILMKEENVEVKREFQGREFLVSWRYELPLWPLLKVCWLEEGAELSYQLFYEPGERLYHSNVPIRIKEARRAYEFLGQDLNVDLIEGISAENYRKTADFISIGVQTDISYISQQIKLIIKNGFLFDKGARRYILPGNVSYFKHFYDYGKDLICDDKDVWCTIPLEMKEKCNCGKSLNPVRRLHYLEYLMQNETNRDIDDFCCMFEFLEGGNCGTYGKVYFDMLKIIYAAMQEIEFYFAEPMQNQIIWTYIWTDKLYEELNLQIQMGTFTLNKYQDVLSKYVDQLEQDLKVDKDFGSLDIIHPNKIDVMRISLLGSVELCLKYWGKNKDEEIKGMAKAIQDSLQFWLKPEGALIEFVVSQEKSRNEWRTFLAKDYRKELNELQKLVFGKGEDCIGIENDFLEIKNILTKKEIKVTDKSVLYLGCLNMPNSKIGKALEDILEKFYLNMDIMDKSEDYAMAEVILSKLPEDYGQQFRRECMVKLIDRMLQNTSDWKEIFESIMYLFGDNLDLHVEFWEKVADEINSMISTELVEWLSRLQLLLPLELGQRLYHAKVRLINKKFEINTM